MSMTKNCKKCEAWSHFKEDPCQIIVEVKKVSKVKN